jgi:hypothetical protein
MSKIFNSDDSTLSSIYDAALNVWETSNDEEKKAMSANLRYDHRVTSTRELLFREFFHRLGDLKGALDEYSRTNVHLTAEPDFCEPWCDNLLVDLNTGFGCDTFGETIELVTVVSLNGLARSLKDMPASAVSALPDWRALMDNDTQASDRSLSGTYVADRFDTWLDNNLFGKSNGEVEEFISNIFEVLNYRLVIERKHYNPVWVTTWPLFDQTSNFESDRWNEVVGVPRYSPTWQIVLKYPLSKVSCLYRPSQLDGGFYPQHFPSPPQAQMTSGGFTMDLASDGTPLLNEFIHVQIELDIAYWIAAGRLIGKTRTTTHNLLQARTVHYDKLAAEFGSEPISDWMPCPE